MSNVSSLHSPTSVLIVEDNIDVADSLARFLRVGAGYYVRVAYDGASAVRMAVNDPPVVVVCDISLPKLNGFQVAQQILSRVDERPLLIAVTAFSGTFPEEQARGVGFDHYLHEASRPIRNRSGHSKPR